MPKEPKKTTKTAGTKLPPAPAKAAVKTKAKTASAPAAKLTSSSGSGGVRIYTLSKELNLSTKEIMSMLTDLGVSVKQPSSAIDAQTAQVVRDLVSDRKKAAEAKTETKTAEKITDVKPADVKEKEKAQKAAVAIVSEKPHEQIEKPAESAAVAVKAQIETAEAEKEKTAEEEVSHPAQIEAEPEKKKEEKTLEVSLPLTVREFAQMVGTPPNTMIKDFLALGMLLSINQTVDQDAAERWAKQHGIQLAAKTKDELVFADDEADKEEDLKPRPPYVTVMGHVDHGKTKLLDAIRKSNVADKEAGGITQHIGAYKVRHHDRNIVFLDTPGHEAFTAMRARGAKITDIVVLVVAADDGVMPQTIEAIHHAKAAGVPIIVAINKIDKPDVNVDRVKRQLSDQGLLPEEWGGDTVCVPVSAKFVKGIDELLEMLLLQADLLELKCNPTARARGTVVEAKLDKGKGPVATVLVQRGTLKVGDVIVVGQTWGKVRAMLDDHFMRVEQSSPGDPVEILGLSAVPQAGDVLQSVADEKAAKKLIDKIKQQTSIQKSMLRVSMKDLYNQIKEGKIKEFNLILKVDVQGSLEAVEQALLSLPQDKVRLHIIHGAASSITETDIMLASASNAVCIGFHAKPTPKALKFAELENVEIKTYDVIYELVEDMKRAMEGLLDPQLQETIIGTARVLQTFRIPKVGVIAGCMIQEGMARRGCEVRVKRENDVLHKGKLDTLRRFKDDVKEVAAGYECGISVSSFHDYKADDVLELFEIKEVKSELVSSIKDGGRNL